MVTKKEAPQEVLWPHQLKNIIRESPGFEKKELSDFKVDLMPLCQFACLYCSSNGGNFIRFNNFSILKMTKDQLGEELSPRTDADKFFITYENVVSSIHDQITNDKRLTLSGATLQFGMLVDNFSPSIVNKGITYEVLKILLERTKFTIRILTKSALVGRDEFVELFQKYKDRVTVGMSCGSLDNKLMKDIELFTAPPRVRAKVINALQSAGVRTFGMFCPVLPGLEGVNEIESLYQAFNPQSLETIWCEPYNDRQNWKLFYDKIKHHSIAPDLHSVMSDKYVWGEYALSLAEAHTNVLKKLKFKGKSIYLLYESCLSRGQLRRAKLIPSVLFQSDPSINEELA